MVDKFLPLLSIFHLLIGILLYNDLNADGILINLLLFWTFFIMYTIKQKQNGIIILAFLVTFFVFLMGQLLFVNILDIEISLIYPLSDVGFSKTGLLMTLSLIGIFWGFVCFKPNIKTIILYENNSFNSCLKLLTYRLFMLTIPFKVLAVFMGIYYTYIYGYASLDAPESFRNSFVIEKMIQLNFLSFCGLLMLSPSKKELMPVLKIFLSIQILSLLEGGRGGLMYSLLFIGIYLYFRDCIIKRTKNPYEEKDLYLTKKIKYIVLISIVPCLIFLNLFALMRHKGGVQSEGAMMDFVGFFLQQGGSYRVIGYTIDFEKDLPKTNTSYTFGPLINLFSHGAIGQITGIARPNLTMDELPYLGNNLGATITNLVVPDMYDTGYGMGTQYIAEVYADFGSYGVLFFSFLLGCVMSKMTFFSVHNWILRTIFCTCVIHFLSLPRDHYLSWFNGIISIFNIGVLFSIYYIAYKKSRVNHFLI